MTPANVRIAFDTSICLSFQKANAIPLLTAITDANRNLNLIARSQVLIILGKDRRLLFKGSRLIFGVDEQ